MSGAVSGLDFDQRIKARDRVVEAAVLSIRNAPAIHYSQDAVLRWHGISKRCNAHEGEFPRYGDCSAMATWWLWNGLYLPFKVGDVVNGAHWQYGYTGTQLQHGKLVVHRRNWRRGDLFIYGAGWPGKHVAMYLGDGFVASHGSEAGPFKVRWDYRSDLMAVRRYI